MTAPFRVGDSVLVLFAEPTPPPWRSGPGMLRDRGVKSADDPRITTEAHAAIARAVADNIALGGWCDAIAWASVVDPLRTRSGSAPFVDDDAADDEREGLRLC